MKITKEMLKNRIAAAGGQRPADTVVKNASIVNVFTGEIMEGDAAIVDGYFAGIGSYDGQEVIDAKGKIMIPGMIDGHVHIESSLLTPREFGKVVLSHGVTSVVTDPHEIANVAGAPGIEYMIEDAERTELDMFVMLPSCVPAAPFESNGAVLEAEHLLPFINTPGVLGLAEVMDFPAVAEGTDVMMDKLLMGHTERKVIDGHAAGLTAEGINIFMAAGIRTDHESVTAAEAKTRLDLGMYLMIREGTVARDLDALFPAITERNARRCLFVTDDKLVDDLVEEGSVDHIVRRAVRKGLDPVTAVQMVTLNAAECFGLQHLGAVAPGYQADFVLLDDLDSFNIHEVYKNGRLVSGNVRPLEETNRGVSAASLPGINAGQVSARDLALPLASDFCRLIEVVPNSIVTKERKEQVTVEDDHFCISPANDQLKIAVIERHTASENIGVGIVKGLGLKSGAIATTISHDSHNIIAAGTSDKDILAAVRHVIQSNGGMAVVQEEKVLASLPLAVAGLMAEKPWEEVYERLSLLNQALDSLGAPQDFDPFLTLSFLALPVIPELKITEKGLFDFRSFSYVNVEVEHL
ncbi:Adenine deaminase [Marinococcus luteus]|uniref:Adenine deaminase n=1 Tax=Marinococcus luteus TaxID=1122204 RepID=A0A1H2URK4_9BACI|nr:adenine deaminase [Marinococcus luteus]SDW58753.1 Adenine deaminase [Marinococcus luteus]